MQHAQAGEYKIYRALFQVDIDDSQNSAELCTETAQQLPNQLTIDSALFNIYIQSQNYAVDMHRILDEGIWQENNITWTNQPTYAIESLHSKQWLYDWTDIELTSQVQRYLDGTEINNGWIFKANDESAAEYNPYRFFSRESGNKPSLKITYSIGSESGTDYCGNDPLGSIIDTDNDGLCDGTGPDNNGSGGSDTDDDGDGYLNEIDLFPVNKLEHEDTDLDGTGNNADLDDDNDNVLDVEDAFPLDNTESIDSDFDGIGNNADTDDDNDGVADELDSEPLNPDVGDTQAPVFAEVGTISLNAQGRLTDISSLINIIAIDAVDGDINGELVGDSLYLSGQHTIEVTATDISGNMSVTEVSLVILPEVSVIAQINGQAGGTYDLGVNLNGAAPSYPVEVLYNIYLNGEVYDEAWVNIISGSQGSIAIDASAYLISGDVISVSLEFATNAFVGKYRQGQIVLSENNFAPQLELSLTQGGEQVTVIDPDNGTVTLHAIVEDINPNDNHNLTWLVKDEAFTDANLDDDALSFEIEPEQLAKGSYFVNVTATESNTVNGFSVTQNIQLVVEQLAILASDIDSDNDGIYDSEEGYSDSDGDGIADYLDDNNNTAELPSSDNTAPMQTAPGLTMALGNLAHASHGSASENASLTLEALRLVVGADAANTQSPHFDAVTPLYNFKVAGLSEHGDSAVVIIPLESGKVLPEKAIYRKYNTRDGWFTFVENAKNSVSSALTDNNGNCPVAYDASYNAGLTVGDDCIQLIIEDGGTNDADFEVNGSVEDPGSVMTATNNTAPVVSIDSHELSYEEGSQVTISSQGSDLENDSLSYQWIQLTGPAVIFDEVTNAEVNITLPEVDSDEVIELQVTVSDGDLMSTSKNQLTVIDVDEVTPTPLPIPEESNESSSGGSFNYFFLYLILMTIYQRRKLLK